MNPTDRKDKIKLLKDLAAGRTSLEQIFVELPLTGETGQHDIEPGQFTCINGRKISLKTIELLRNENRIVGVIF